MQHEKKTIFITVSVGMIARNLLRNDFFKLMRRFYHVVIITPLYEDQEFTKQFGREGVSFEELKDKPLKRGEKFFNSLHKALIYNPTVRIKSYYGMTTKHRQERTIRKIFRNEFERIVFGLFLSKIRFLRDVIKNIDALFYHPNKYQPLFDLYRPVSCFITNIASDEEVYLLRLAKKNKVLNIGMTKSWDNFSKIGFREKVDHLIVWSDFMKDEALRFQNYKSINVSVVGIPQFDLYADVSSQYTRDDFIQTYGLDQNKKIILFGHAGTTLTPDDPYIVSIIKDWIIEEKKPYQLLVRPHFGHKDSINIFKHLEDNRVVFIDQSYKRSGFQRGGWDISPEHQTRLALSMHFSDVVVSSTTTLVLDAIASGNNVICYAFDKDKKTPYANSIKRLYETLWFKELQRYGLTSSMVMSREELLERIEATLTDNQKMQPPEYSDIIKRFCYTVDGKSGERLFNVINNLMPSEVKR